MTGEANLYRKAFKFNGQDAEIYVGQYVDDTLISASSDEVLQWFLKKLGARFPLNPKASGYITEDDPGLLLSMHVRYNRAKGTLQFDQRNAIESLAKKLQLND
jgi:hypothetical protein